MLSMDLVTIDYSIMKIKKPSPIRRGLLIYITCLFLQKSYLERVSIRKFKEAEFFTRRDSIFVVARR